MLKHLSNTPGTSVDVFAQQLRTQSLSSKPFSDVTLSSYVYRVQNVCLIYFYGSSMGILKKALGWRTHAVATLVRYCRPTFNVRCLQWTTTSLKLETSNVAVCRDYIWNNWRLLLCMCSARTSYYFIQDLLKMFSVTGLLGSCGCSTYKRSSA